jgi:hypothetical protein
MLLHLSEAENLQLATLTYMVTVEARFTRSLSGNPDMPRYVKWSSDITEGLQNEFDEKIAWDRLRDQLALSQIAR